MVLAFPRRKKKRKEGGDPKSDEEQRRLSLGTTQMGNHQKNKPSTKKL